MSSITVLHANRNTLVRAGLRSILMKGGGVDRVLEAENAQEMFQTLQAEEAHVLIVDFDQPGAFSEKDVAVVRSQYPDLKILIISTEGQHNRILAILETGVHGYLTRECDEDEIINAVFSIAGGEKFYCNKVINIILDKKLAPEEEENCEPTSLSERETEIITLISSGLTNKEIAEELCLSPHTIHTHRKNIMKKLGVNSASGIVLYAVNAGLIQTAAV